MSSPSDPRSKSGFVHVPASSALRMLALFQVYTIPGTTRADPWNASQVNYARVHPRCRQLFGRKRVVDVCIEIERTTRSSKDSLPIKNGQAQEHKYVGQHLVMCYKASATPMVASGRDNDASCRVVDMHAATSFEFAHASQCNGLSCFNSFCAWARYSCHGSPVYMLARTCTKIWLRAAAAAPRPPRTLDHQPGRGQLQRSHQAHRNPKHRTGISTKRAKQRKTDRKNLVFDGPRQLKDASCYISQVLICEPRGLPRMMNLITLLVEPQLPLLVLFSMLLLGHCRGRIISLCLRLTQTWTMWLCLGLVALLS
jgi:hypothetical protein